MCMGPTHALGGAALGVVAVDAWHTVAGTTLTLPAILACATLAAGGALLNDLDSPSSTASHAAGRLTGWVSWVTCGASRLAFRLTATESDRRYARGAHRGVTHTLTFAVTLTVGLIALSRLGWPATLGVATATLFLGTRVAIARWGRVNGFFAALAGAGLVWWTLRTGTPSWLLGAAVGVGVLSHTLLDGCTTDGVPFWWPLKLRGRRWRRVGTPRPLRFETNGAAETWVKVTLGMTAVLALPPMLTTLEALAHRR